jgi:hypothetical protein
MRRFLIANGWKEVHGWWQAPLTITGKPHYFSLEGAYALETEGEGILAYSTQELHGELLKAADVASNEAKEAAYFAETGLHHGVYPNY